MARAAHGHRHRLAVLPTQHQSQPRVLLQPAQQSGVDQFYLAEVHPLRRQREIDQRNRAGVAQDDVAVAGQIPLRNFFGRHATRQQVLQHADQLLAAWREVGLDPLQLGQQKARICVGTVHFAAALIQNELLILARHQTGNQLAQRLPIAFLHRRTRAHAVVGQHDQIVRAPVGKTAASDVDLVNARIDTAQHAQRFTVQRA